MDRNKEICEWFRRLGYDGDFPENLDKICTSATSFIWDQLEQKIKPRTEVENIKQNILVSRLLNNALEKEGTFKYPLKEITLYLRKKELEKKLKNLNYSISEKQKTNLHLQQQNKIKRFSIEKINVKIREDEEREFLLREKLKILKKDTKDAETILNCPINTSLPDQENSKDITQHLNKCQEQLQDVIKQIPLPSKNYSNETINRWMLSTQKTARKINIFEKNLRLTETTKKQREFKKMKPSENSNFPNKVNVCLFSNENDLSYRNIPKIERRDSIDLDIELNDDENFLVDVSKASFWSVPSNNRFGLKPQTARKTKIGTSHLSEASSILPTNQDISKSIIKLQNATKTDTSHLFKTSTIFPTNQDTSESVMKTIFNKSASNNDIRDLLCKYNRQSIWNSFQVLDDNLHFNISKKINFLPINSQSTKKHVSEDLAALHSQHVLTELKIIKNNIILKQLNEKLNKKKENINMALLDLGYSSEIIENLQKKLALYIEDIGLDYLIEAMKREINIIHNLEEVNSESEIKKKLAEINNDITLKRNSILQYLDSIQYIFHSINHTRNLTLSCVRKLALESSDLEWYSLLTENVNSNEITVFEEFPLEHNRKCINTDSLIFYKDMHTDRFLSNREINKENLIMLTNILESPFTAPETILLNILREKCKLEAMKSIKYSENNNCSKKYSLEELQTRESYIEFTLERFNSLVESLKSKKTLSASSVAKKVMEIWIEMPFNKFISSNRTVEDKDYKHFEKLFDFYNNFQNVEN